MAVDVVTLALAKNYTKKSLIGLGALQGAPCVVKSIADAFGTAGEKVGTEITFEWTATDGTVETDSFVIYNGADGANGLNGTNGINGKTPTFTFTDIVDADNEKIGTKVEVFIDSNSIGSFNVMDGEKGADGKTPTFDVKSIFDDADPAKEIGKRVSILIDDQIVNSIEIMNGEKGDTGFGIDKIEIREDGHLWITTSEPKEIDAGVASDIASAAPVEYQIHENVVVLDETGAPTSKTVNILEFKNFIPSV